MNWLAAQKLKNDLSDLNSDATLCPSHLLSGIKALLQASKSWLGNLELKPCPPSIDAPKLVRELGKEVRLAEKVALKSNPPTPQRESKRKKQKKELDEDFIDISRGNALLFMGRVSRKKPAAAKAESKKNAKKIQKEQQENSKPVKTAKEKKPSQKESKESSTNHKKPAAIKIVPKKRKIDLQQLENSKSFEEEENFSLSFAKEKRSQSPKHIKLKLPMTALTGLLFKKVI